MTTDAEILKKAAGEGSHRKWCECVECQRHRDVVQLQSTAGAYVGSGRPVPAATVEQHAVIVGSYDVTVTGAELRGAHDTIANVAPQACDVPLNVTPQQAFVDNFTEYLLASAAQVFVPPPRLAVLPGYEKLAAVLDEALEQAQSGKGKERHASGEAFEDQPIVQINLLLGSSDGALFQMMKKFRESKRLPADRRRHERLGALIYMVAAILIEEELEVRRGGK